MTDYIIVGLGFGGLAVARELERVGKTFVVYENMSQKASLVAGGIYNPVILKRFTLAWGVREQLPVAMEFYDQLEKDLNINFHSKLPIYRRFNSIEEQNNWFSASDKVQLDGLLDYNLKKEINSNINGNFSFGKINQTGVIDTTRLINSYKQWLQKNKLIKLEKFNYEGLKVSANAVQYDGIKAKGVIFCEGFGLQKNPFFNYLPLTGNKGEYIIIKAPNLQLDVMVKSSVFIIPMGNDMYRVGASYKHDDHSSVPTEETRDELISALNEMIRCDYEVVGQEAGIRPSTADRKPIVGPHPIMKNLYVCNGFGSRGLLIAPSAAKILIGFLEGETEIDKEIDIDRFTKKFFSKPKINCARVTNKVYHFLKLNNQVTFTFIGSRFAVKAFSCFNKRQKGIFFTF